MNTTRLALVRHGETHANVDRIWHGRTDSKLTELGYQQARVLGEYFHNYMQATVVVSSPLHRAHTTAEPIAAAFGLDVSVDDRLMEFDLGDWEDRTFDSLNELGEDIKRELVENPDYHPPNGESQNTVNKRFNAALDDIISQHSGENIVVVAHGVAMAIALASRIHNDTRKWPNNTMKNAAYSELCLDTNTLLCFDRTDHLGY